MWWVLGAVAVAAVLSTYLGWTAHRVERVHVRAASAERALDAHLVRRAAAAAVVAEHEDVAELYAAARLALDAEPGEREAAENDLTRALQALPLSPSSPLSRSSPLSSPSSPLSSPSSPLSSPSSPLSSPSSPLSSPSSPLSGSSPLSSPSSPLSRSSPLRPPSSPLSPSSVQSSPALLDPSALLGPSSVLIPSSVSADSATRTLIATSRRVVLARQVHTDLVRDALTARRRPLVRVLGMARRYPRPSYFDIVEPALLVLPPIMEPVPTSAPEPPVPVEAA